MPSAEIQRALLARGYGLGPSGADEYAGPRTIAAVAAFQRGEPQVFPFRHSKGLRVLSQEASSAPASPALMARTSRKPKSSGMCVRNRLTTRLAGTPAMLRRPAPEAGCRISWLVSAPGAGLPQRPGGPAPGSRPDQT